MSTYSTEVEIGNGALDLLDEAEIQSLTENNKAARAINRQILKSRDIVLAESHWKFAKTSKALSNDATAPVHPRWANRSAIPGDCVTVIALWDGDPENVDSRPIPEEHWDREGSLILHDLEEYPTLEYVSNATNFGATVSRWTAKAAEAWVYHLAASVAKKVTGDPRPDLKTLYVQDKLPTAQLKEGHQGRVGENLQIHRRIKRSPLVRGRNNYRISSA